MRNSLQFPTVRDRVSLGVVVVKRGITATALSGGPLPAGTTIYNTDTVNSVWLSSARNVTPNNGMELGPLGSAEWSNDQTQAFACVDTGVSADMLLIVSQDLSNVQNPVAIGAAIAAKLLVTGIPNVLLEDSIVTSPVAVGTYNYDVSGYASITVYTSNATATLAQYDISGNRVWYEDISSVGQMLSFIAQIVGVTLRLIVTGASAQVSITASNRSALLRLDSRTKVTQIDQWTCGTVPIAMIAGTDYLLAQSDTDVHCQGQCYMYASTGFISGAANPKGYFYLRDNTGSLAPLIDTADMTVGAAGYLVGGRLVAVPHGPYKIYFACRVVNATGYPGIWLTQGAL